MTAAALERLKLTHSAWRCWFAQQVAAHGPTGVAYRIQARVGEVRDWASGETRPPYHSRIGIFALLDDTDGPPLRLRLPRRKPLPLPADLDLTLPLLTLMARYGGAEGRYQKLRKEAGIQIPAGRRPGPTGGQPEK